MRSGRAHHGSPSQRDRGRLSAATLACRSRGSSASTTAPCAVASFASACGCQCGRVGWVANSMVWYAPGMIGRIVRVYEIFFSLQIRHQLHGMKKAEGRWYSANTRNTTEHALATRSPVLCTLFCAGIGVGPCVFPSQATRIRTALRLERENKTLRKTQHTKRVPPPARALPLRAEPFFRHGFQDPQNLFI